MSDPILFASVSSSVPSVPSLPVSTLAPAMTATSGPDWVGLLVTALGISYLALGAYQLALHARRVDASSPSSRLWLGLAYCAAGGLALFSPAGLLASAWPEASRRILAMLVHLAIPPLMLFLWPFLGREPTGWHRIYSRAQVALAALAPLVPMAGAGLAERITWLSTLPFLAWVAQAVAVGVLAGNRRAMIMLWGCGPLIVVILAETILRVGGWGSTEPLPAVAFAVFAGAVAYAESERLGQVHSELELLRQQLERMVDDRTTELSAANERLQAEIAERQLAEEAMHMLERAVEQSIDGIAVADLAGNMQFINEAWAHLHGYEVFELLGYDLTIFHTPEQMLDQVQPLMDKVQEQGAHSAEIEHRRRGGATFPTWQTATCLQDPDGSPIGFVFIVRDITERKKEEEERRRLEERVRQAEKLESLGSLAGGIAHDYNNILTGVLGNVGLALQEADRQSDLFQRLRQIEASAERAAELTDQLLAYAGEEQQISRTVQLNDLVADHRQTLEQIAERAGARLEVHLKNGLPLIQGDPSQLLQALSNLLSNAVDSLGAASDDPGLIMLRTSVVTAKGNYFEGAVLDDDRGEGRYVFFEVSDSGRGMDTETRAKMFEPFFSTKAQGRGMGLAAVLGIARAHHGNIRVFSQPDRGTTVEVLFPAMPDNAVRDHADTPAVQTWEGFGTALVVDDEQLVREVAAKVLQRQGFEVLVAVNGKEALEVFVERKDEIRLVLLDLTMPEMDGETFLREMSRFESDAEVLMMSGYREQAATQGVDGAQLAGFLHKPFRPNELLRKVREILG